MYFFLQGTLKDCLDRYSLYGLEENASYESNFKNEIEDIIKLVSTSIFFVKRGSKCYSSFPALIHNLFGQEIFKYFVRK